MQQQRDYFTNWEYHVPTEAKPQASVDYAREKLTNEDGFLVIPLSLHNLSKTIKTLRSEYYVRFDLKDGTGRAASLTDREHLKIPTRLFCRTQGLPEWTEKNVRVSPDETISTALVFQLLPDTKPPYTLGITVYDISTPHRYNIKLATKMDSQEE